MSIPRKVLAGRLDAGREELVRRLPWIAPAAEALRWGAEPPAPFAAVSLHGLVLRGDAVAMRRWTPAEAAGAIYHELHHLLDGDGRLGAVDNIARDLVINQRITTEGIVPLPPDAVLPADAGQPADRSWQYYRKALGARGAPHRRPVDPAVAQVQWLTARRIRASADPVPPYWREWADRMSRRRVRSSPTTAAIVSAAKALLCPQCGAPSPTAHHTGSRACRAQADRRQLTARGFVVLPAALRAAALASKVPWCRRSTPDLWVTSSAAKALEACGRIAAFLGRTTASLVREMMAHRTPIGHAVEVARVLVWNHGAVHPCRALCACGQLVEGTLVWRGARFHADGSVEIRLNGGWRPVDVEAVRVLVARRRRGAAETEGERSIRLTWRPPRRGRPN